MTGESGAGLSLLADVKVVDFTQALSGPYCTLILADLGADVVKVEPPLRGDDSRHWGPPFVGEDAAYFVSVNRNKRSVTLDLKDPEDVARALALIAEADVVVENWRPGTAERLGLGAERLRALHPGLIICSISGFGQDRGPRSGYDQIVQGTSGVMSLTGPVGEPTKWGVPVGDISAGMFAAHAILAALYDRHSSHVGRTIDVAMQDSLVAMLTHHAARYLSNGVPPVSDHNLHATIAPYGMFRAADGFLNICVGNDSQWQRLCGALECPELADDPRFATNSERLRHRAVLLALIERALATRSVTEATAALDLVGVPAGRVRDVAEVLDDDATAERDMLLHVDRPGSNATRVVNTPWKLDGVAPTVRIAPPRLGEHTAEVLADLVGPTPSPRRRIEDPMSSPDSQHDVNRALASALADAGADTAFGMPGGGNNLDFIGAAEEAGIRFVLAHAETPAAIMAAVYADLSDTPTACVVTRGPGAASAVNGVANALLERQQLLLVSDSVSSADSARIAHQQLDQRALFAPVTKWSATLGTGDTNATARQAVATSMTHPRGPVHIDVDPSGLSTPSGLAQDVAVGNGHDIGRLATLLDSARRPIVLLGGGARAAVGPVRALLQHSPAPVLMTYRGKGVVPDSWPAAAGLLTGATTEAPLLESADLIVMIGVDTVELIPNAWPYAAPVVSVAAWADSARYLVPQVELVGDLEKLIGELAVHWPATDWAQDAGRTHLEQERARLLAAGPDEPRGLSPQQVVQRVRAVAPKGTIATVDAGAHMLPSMCLWDTEDWDEVLISSGLATMGFALPAAIGAALARPGRQVVCFTGDGGLGMCLGELETVRRLGLAITVVVFNDACLSLIALKAKPEGNGVPNAVEYTDTDFAAVARGYGLKGVRVEAVGALDRAVAESCASGKPTLIDARVDPTGYPAIVAAIRGRR